MARFIDSDKLICQVQNNDKYGTIIKQVFISLLQNTETEDVAPVVHAHWIELYDPISYVRIGYEYVPKTIINCSNCTNGVEVKTPYCPHCGAKMDEEV